MVRARAACACTQSADGGADGAPDAFPRDGAAGGVAEGGVAAWAARACAARGYDGDERVLPVELAGGRASGVGAAARERGACGGGGGARGAAGGGCAAGGVREGCGARWRWGCRWGAAAGVQRRASRESADRGDGTSPRLACRGPAHRLGSGGTARLRFRAGCRGALLGERVCEDWRGGVRARRSASR